MAGLAQLTTKLIITGIGDDVEVSNLVELTTPIEYIKGFAIVDTAATTALQLLSDTTKIALDKVFGVYIKAQSGTIYIALNSAGTATFDTTTADLTLISGESCYLPINSFNNAGIKIDALTTSDSFSYIILGKI